MGGGERVQYTANVGQEWTGICTTTQRRDFQVSKKEFFKRAGVEFQSSKRGYQKGIVGMHLYGYTVLIKDCV
jgi:hypothetical protein